MLEAIKKGLLENGVILNSDVHLAIVNEPFLSYIKNGEKTIESRFTKNKIAPYNQIRKNDIVCMKEAGKPIDSIFIVGDAQFYENNSRVLNDIRSKFSNRICAFDDSFWEMRKEKRYISLISIKEVINLKKPFNVPKKDKRAWIKFEEIMPQNIILLAGKIGSGKTYWANQIADYFNCARSSFSSYIKYKCNLKTLECSRQNMQCIGAEVVRNELDEFIRYTVSFNNTSKKNIVIDGLRHKEVYDRIKILYPNSNVIIVYVDCTEEQREKNIFNRGDKLDGSDKISMEIDAMSLKENAQHILHYSDEPTQEMQGIASFLQMDNLFDV